MSDQFELSKVTVQITFTKVKLYRWCANCRWPILEDQESYLRERIILQDFTYGSYTRIQEHCHTRCKVQSQFDFF